MHPRRGWLALFALAPTLAAAQAQTQCLIEPHQKVEIKSPVSAVITAILVDRGATVRRGQPLITLDSEVERASLAAQAYRAVMEGQIRSAQARVTNAREKLNRREELRLEAFISAQDRDDAAAELRVAEADLLEAKDNRELARLDARRLEAAVSRYTLTSPIQGVVTDRLLNPGELAQAGDNAGTVLKLAQIDPLRVDLVLPLAKYGSIRPGVVVDVRSEAPFSSAYKATVRVVDRVMDSASGTFRVRMELPNPKGNIPAGVKCSVTL